MSSIVQNKSRYQVDMCQGPLLRKIVVFSIPLICSGVLQLLFHAVDLIVLGRFASYQALAAVGVTGSITHLLTIICLGVSIGANERNGKNDDFPQQRSLAHIDLIPGFVLNN